MESLSKTDNKLLNLNAHLDLAIAYRRLGRYDEAIKSSNMVIRMDSQNAEGYRRLAQVRAALEMYLFL